MNRRQLLTIFAASALTPLIGGSPAFAEARRITGPFTHENLTLYFIHGPSEDGPVPLTLTEALREGVVQVVETQDVNELKIKNTGKKPVFIQSGDIVKGGQQDRVLTVSLLLPPKSGLLPIASFCVEQGRWEQRAGEDVKKFSASEKALPSKEMKLALKARQIEPSADASQIADTGARQQKVWAEVKKTQDKLSGALNTAVAAPASESSLQLALENGELDKVKAKYVKALTASAAIPDDAIGFAFAINGVINSADVYASNGLFKKLWPKLIDAAATEAIAERSAARPTPPAPAAVEAFLASAESGKSDTRGLPAKIVLENRENDKSVYSETRLKGGPALHRNYLAK
jgi:hypothetical protein